eukprot:m.133162 g.133162  ORF g.133162 m.133162 type:complete len:367 (+) comp38110_c0_seq10:18-1118(+)
MSFRNPSPPAGDPPDLDVTSDDTISSTVYSKSWVLGILACLLKDHETDHSEIEEIDADVEESLCQLWDAAADKDVVDFLIDSKVIDVALKILTDTSKLRLREICVGILGNMVCMPSACEKLTSTREAVSALWSLLGCGDPPTILETVRQYFYSTVLMSNAAMNCLLHTRLLRTCLSDKKCSSRWLSQLDHTTTQKDLFFILKSSLKVDLLVACGHLLNDIFDMDEKLMDKMAGSECIEAVCEALNQVKDPSHSPIFIMVMYSLTTTESSVKAIVCASCTVLPAVSEYVISNSTTKMEIDDHQQELSAACSVLHTLIQGSDNSHKKLSTDYSTLGKALENMRTKVSDVQFQELISDLLKLTKSKQND